MKNTVIAFLLTAVFGLISCPDLLAQSTIVEKFGQLSVNGNYIIGEQGDTVQLRGMSLFWSQWMGQFYNKDCIKWLKNNWKCTVVRAAMGVENGGYLDNSTDEIEKVIAVVDAAVQLGIYVIIDYHSHEAHLNPEPAKLFFAQMAKKYGHYPNILYEIYNEPLQHHSWARDIKPYAKAVIEVIRQHDHDNIIIVGTRQWSQMVNEAAMTPIKLPNIAYTLHFYAASHKEWLREEAKLAIDNGACLFVTEFGTCNAIDNGILDLQETKVWFDFMDKYKISWCNWSVADKEETASSVKQGVNAKGKWPVWEITKSGRVVRRELIKENGPIYESLVK